MNTSTKPFELLYIEYYFEKYTRKLSNRPKWKHLRFYQTEEGVKDAFNAFQPRGYSEFPGESFEALYPDYKPIIVITRYKWVRRF
jgi:hypothetical protein